MDGDGEPAGDLTPADRGRGVLEGAFRLLDVLSRAPAGAGLSEVSRDAGLPKASAYRLLEQLVDLAAVRRDDRRYFVGAHLARLGAAWQPDPVLERAAREPVRLLSALGSSVALVTVLRENRVRAVSATRGVVTEIPRIRPYDEFPVRSAAGRLLLVGSRAADDAPPAGFGDEEWRCAVKEFRRTGAVVDQQDVLPGVCCVAAPVRGPAGDVVAAVSALVVKPTLPAGLTELVVRASREVTRNLELAASVR